MVLEFNKNGSMRTIYTEDINLTEIGSLKITRASHVEPNNGGWEADMAPVGGPVLGPFKTRTEALKAEVKWLENKLINNELR